MEFKITETQVFGLENAARISGFPMSTDTYEKYIDEEKNISRLKRLGSAPIGSGHDCALKGVTVIADVTAPIYMWKQLQRYHWFEIISSQSTMHCVAKMNLAQQCVKEVWPETLAKLSTVIENYNKEENNNTKQKMFREIIANLPQGLCLTAGITTNYLQLKTIYKQRDNHKLSEWRAFRKWCEKLPRFLEVTKK